jgi:hypothetical protein
MTVGFHKLGTVNDATREASELSVDDEARNLLVQLRLTWSATEASRIIRQLLEKAGTDCDINDADPYGDGDQSPIENCEAKAQILRELFADGGDLTHWLQRNQPGMSRFIFNCIMGDSQAVEDELKAAPTFEQRKKLMENRVSAMRLPALIMTLAASKYPRPDHRSVKKRMNHVEVVRVLLRYGARPNAKEVTGKTGMVCVPWLIPYC